MSQQNMIQQSMIQQMRLWRNLSSVVSCSVASVNWKLCPRHMRQQLSALFLSLFAALISFSCWVNAAEASSLSLSVSSMPMASLHTYQEQPGQTTFRSKQSLRDRKDRSWQIILFKRYQSDDLQGLYLRLVGFPGIVTLDETQPLTIATGASLQWKANPELDPQTPSLPENAGQYNVAEAITALTGDIPLQVDVPLGGGGTAQVVVPPFAVHEWRELAAQSPAA